MKVPLLLPLKHVQILSSAFSNVLNLLSSLRSRDQVSYPYKTKGKITVLCMLMCKFLLGERTITDSELNGSKHTLNLNYFYLCHEHNFGISFLDTWPLPQFWRIYQLTYISLYYDTELHSGEETKYILHFPT